MFDLRNVSNLPLKVAQTLLPATVPHKLCCIYFMPKVETCKWQCEWGSKCHNMGSFELLGWAGWNQPAQHTEKQICQEILSSKYKGKKTPIVPVAKESVQDWANSQEKGQPEPGTTGHWEQWAKGNSAQELSKRQQLAWCAPQGQEAHIP